MGTHTENNNIDDDSLNNRRTVPFFILGTQRGGTTLLRLMLNRNSQICIPPESHFIIPLFKKFDPNQVLNKAEQNEARLIITSHPRFNTWDVTAAGLSKLIDLLPDHCTLALLIDKIFEKQIESTGKTNWGDKTPEYIDIIPQLSAAFPDCRFIAIIRDGRDVAASLKQRGWQGWSIYQRANYWKHCVQQMMQLKAIKNNTLFTRYEDLVLDTKETLTSIMSFLNVIFEESMPGFYIDAVQNITGQEIKSGVHAKLSRSPSNSDTYKWKTNQSKTQIWLFESVCYKELQSTAYEIAYFRPGNKIHQLGKHFYRVAGSITIFAYNIYHLLFSGKSKQKLRKNKLYNILRQTVRKT